MANILFGYPNLLDSATLSGGSWESTLPLANLQNAALSKVARSTNDALASTIINVDLGAESRVLRVVSILAHNLSRAALVRTRIGEDSGFSTSNYDSGWVDALPVIYPAGVLAYGDGGWWDGKLGKDELDLGYPIDYHLLPSPIPQGEFLRIEINDTTNPANYVEIGRMVISPGYQPTINMRQGTFIGWNTSSRRTEMEGGAFKYDERPRRRVLNFVIPNIPEDESLVKLDEIQRRQGTHDPFLTIYDPSDTHHLHRRSIWGTIRRLSPLRVPYATHADQAFSIIQEL
jgi:hypothetical protein